MRRKKVGLRKFVEVGVEDEVYELFVGRHRVREELVVG